MTLKAHSQKDLYAGLLLVITGTAFAYVSTGYELGTAVAMGPGYFPFGLGLILAAIGAVVLAKSFGRTGSDERVGHVNIRVVACVIASVVLFGALIVPLGLVASIFVLVCVASLGSHELDLKQALVVAAVLSALCVGTFIYGLGVQMPVWPAMFGG